MPVTNGCCFSLSQIGAPFCLSSWGYCEIGQTLYDRGLPTGQPLSSRWIEMYNSREFAELADWLRSFIDTVALESGEQARNIMLDDQP